MTLITFSYGWIVFLFQETTGGRFSLWLPGAPHATSGKDMSGTAIRSGQFVGRTAAVPRKLHLFLENAIIFAMMWNTP
jgi:hypothetical protein